MKRYRFEFFTGRDVQQIRQAEYDDDQQAKVFAEGSLNAADGAVTSVEVWRSTRLVCRIEREG